MLQELISTLPALSAVEELINQKLDSEAKLITEISSYLLKLGGKRIRPALSLLVGESCGIAIRDLKNPQLQRIIEIGAGIELIHMATLLHDDIIDKSLKRRNSASAFARFGLSSTLLTGDFLLTRAFGLCAHLDQTVVEATEQACVELTEGEIEETSLLEKTHTLDSSLAIARKKTACLFRLAAFCGAHLSEAPIAVEQKFSEFGESLGLAFQILDDILDVEGDEKKLGKNAGQDIRERKPSVVNVLWLATNSTLAKKLSQAPDDDEEEFIVKAIAELKGSAVVEKARAIARDYGARARQALMAIASQANVKKLLTLVDYLESRVA